MALISVEEALGRVLGDAKPVGRIQSVPLSQAGGRVLARDLPALRTQPPFSASAMDGYAVRAADAAKAGVELEMIGESAAGHGFSGTLGKGQTVRIFTGAPMPSGADTVIMQEMAIRQGDTRVSFSEPAQPGRHVRTAGVDFMQGDAGLLAGKMLDATSITLAAAMNYPELPVIDRPKIAILATGDELRLPGETLGPGQIIASNTFGIAALARAAGAEVFDLGIAADTIEALDHALDSAVTAQADVLVTIGGASVGDHDLVQKALGARGMVLDFWKIAMRPGKPLMSGRLGPMRVLGLPGNPASSLVCAYLFLEPLICRLGGRNDPGRLKNAFLSSDLPANDKRQDYIRARLKIEADDRMTVSPMARQDSSLMSVFADADCLIVRPPLAPAAKVGESTSVLVLRP